MLFFFVGQIRIDGLQRDSCMFTGLERFEMCIEGELQSFQIFMIFQKQLNNYRIHLSAVHSIFWIRYYVPMFGLLENGVILEPQVQKNFSLLQSFCFQTHKENLLLFNPTPVSHSFHCVKCVQPVFRVTPSCVCFAPHPLPPKANKY